MAEQVLKVTLSRNGSKTEAYFKVAENQQEIIKNFVAVFAHNAGLDVEYGFAVPEGKTQIHPANASSVENVIAKCSQSIRSEES